MQRPIPPTGNLCGDVYGVMGCGMCAGMYIVMARRDFVGACSGLWWSVSIYLRRVCVGSWNEAGRKIGRKRESAMVRRFMSMTLM